MSRRPKIMLSAGEASGDRLGAGLARALRRRHPDVELIGMGGDEMAEAGVRLVQHASEVAVVGLIEVLSHLPRIRAAMGRLEACMARERPDLLVPIDFPDFNLSLARRAGRAGVDVVYFVSPQVWAWRRRRVHRIRRLVRRMLVLFPFELPFYEEAGVPVTFVGHPVVESVATLDPAALRRRIGLEGSGPLVALLPGSRLSEIGRLLPPILDAAARLRRDHADVDFVLPRARTLEEGALREAVTAAGLERVRVHSGDYPELLTACAAGVVASGTASLEAAVAGLPVVVVYRVQPLTYLLGRALVRVDHVALPNLVAGRPLVPELVQGECTPDHIARELGRLLDDPAEASRIREGLAVVRERLGGPGAFERAADAVWGELPK